MEPKFQSSFIPRGPVGTTATISRAGNIGSGGIFGFLAIILFVLSVAGSIAVYGYNTYLLSRISQMGADLEAARTTLEPESIKELTQLNTRILTTSELLSKHTVLSPLFDYLESATVRNVRFTQFSYSTTERGLTLSMGGQARGYTSVALQSDVFNQSKYLKNPIFGDLNLDKNGNVIFSFIATIDPSIISYKKQLENGAVPAVLTPEPSAAVSTSTPTSISPTPSSTSTPVSAGTSSPQR
jgi:hypothetical protein